MLVGHSLGGMSVLALAAQRPELFSGRILGIALLATSAGHLVQALAGRTTGRLLVRSRLLLGYLALVWLSAPLLERLAPLRTWVSGRFLRRCLFGADPVPADIAAVVQEMLAQTRHGVAAAFYPTFVHYDRGHALAVLRTVPTLALCGAADRVTPARHSRRIAAEIGPAADLVVLRAAGHMVNLPHFAAVDAALHQLLDREQHGRGRGPGGSPSPGSRG